VVYNGRRDKRLDLEAGRRLMCVDEAGGRVGDDLRRERESVGATAEVAVAKWVMVPVRRVEDVE
jgi:hypothetical protein